MLKLTSPSEGEGARVPKACLQCARAKVKCEAEAGNEICKRCRRLRKPCSEQTAGAHRGVLKRKTDVSRLEQKLDGVAAILAASQRTGAGNGVDHLSLSEVVAFRPEVCVSQFVQSDGEAEIILCTFRDSMAPHFPFVVITPSLTFQELRKTKPFLSLTILMIGCRHDSERQLAIGKKIRELIGNKLLGKGERSLDIFQGLLLFSGWYYVHVNLGSQLGNLIHLVMAMMTDLGLHKASYPRTFVRPSPSTMGYFGRPLNDSFGKSPPPSNMFELNKQERTSLVDRTLEERRAYLGCFYLTSIISMCARDIEPIRASSYTEECCQILYSASEYSTDVYLLHLVHLHCLGDKISRTLVRDEWDPSYSVSSTPMGIYVRSIEVELSHFKEYLCSQDASFRIHYHAIEASLYEIALNDSIDHQRYGRHPLTQLDMLFACLNSTKSCLDAFFDLPLLSWFSIPLPIWLLMGHMMVLSSKLCLYTRAGWDPKYAKSILNFCNVVDKLEGRLEEAKSLTELPLQQISSTHGNLPLGIPEPLSSLAPKLQHIKKAHERKYAAQMAKEEGPVSDEFSNIGSDLATADMSEFILPVDTGLFEFFDESFWQQLA